MTLLKTTGVGFTLPGQRVMNAIRFFAFSAIRRIESKRQSNDMVDKSRLEVVRGATGKKTTGLALSRQPGFWLCFS